MVKRTRTMAATVKEGRKFTAKPKAPRTSTIEATIAAKNDGFKNKKRVAKKAKRAPAKAKAAPKRAASKAKPAQKTKPVKKVVAKKTAKKVSKGKKK